MTLQALIFDLDGVITDTAEFHFLAWQRLASELGITFTREDNEQLRGVPRRESLLFILSLGNHFATEDEIVDMMARKNSTYVDMLDKVSPDDLLPGVPDLLDKLDSAGILYCIGSASRNSPNVVRRLGLADRMQLVAHGGSVPNQKPAPDLFRYAAAQMGVTPDQCIVVEDAAAGVSAALAGGIAALALGPAERFGALLAQTDRVMRRDDLVGLELGDLRALVSADPTWIVADHAFSAETQHHIETAFTTGNGYFASRGALEEGYPDDIALTFAHGVFDDMPVSFTELANLPNWLDFALTVDGHTFRLDRGRIHKCTRRLDLQRGVLQRTVRWEAPSGAVLDLTFERFISYAHEHVGAIRLVATAVNRACDVIVQCGIDGHVSNEDLLHWRLGEQGRVANDTVWLRATTRHSDIQLAVAASVRASAETSIANCPGVPRVQTVKQLEPGQSIQVDKLASYTTSRDLEAADGPVLDRALAELDGRDYDSVKRAHVAAWRDVWQAADVVIEGDDEAQLAVRFSMFQLIVAAPQRDERVSIGAKTLSGFGYRGHVFWDTEIFILPFFALTQPALARNMLMYRYHTLPGARRKAAATGFDGAQYPWESATTGDEVTPPWIPDFHDPTRLVRIWIGETEIHISADIAYAIHHYWRVTGDDAFLRDYGAEMILDTARFWASRAEYETTSAGYQYAFRDVVGPDEYHDHVDNNVFTNRMAQWHLQLALDTLDWLQTHAPSKHAQLTEQLAIDDGALAHWRDVRDHIVINHDPKTGLMVQFDGFFELEAVDWPAFEGRTKSMQFLLGIEGAQARQVIKQADVIMLLCLLRDAYDDKTWQTNWDTYMPITDHQYGSSLGPSFHAWAACEINRPNEAYDHFMLAARADLRNIRGNADEGIHAASAGGVWQAVVFGFAGLRTNGGVSVTPRLPDHWQRVAFSVVYHGQRYRVDIRRGQAPRIEPIN